MRKIGQNWSSHSPLSRLKNVGSVRPGGGGFLLLIKDTILSIFLQSNLLWKFFLFLISNSRGLGPCWKMVEKFCLGAVGFEYLLRAPSSIFSSNQTWANFCIYNSRGLCSYIQYTNWHWQKYPQKFLKSILIMMHKAGYTHSVFHIQCFSRRLFAENKKKCESMSIIPLHTIRRCSWTMTKLIFHQKIGFREMWWKEVYTLFVIDHSFRKCM